MNVLNKLKSDLMRYARSETHNELLRVSGLLEAHINERLS